MLFHDMSVQFFLTPGMAGVFHHSKNYLTTVTVKNTGRNKNKTHYIVGASLRIRLG